MSSVSSAKDLEIVGFWISEGEDPNDMTISKNGAGYKVELVFGEMVLDGVFKDGVIKTSDGDISFSKDLKVATFEGEKFQRIADDKAEKVRSEMKAQWHREACVFNMMNVQGAMRGHAMVNKMKEGDPLAVVALWKVMPAPKCPAGGKYSYKDTVPKKGVPFCTCSLAAEAKHKPEDPNELEP